MQERKRLVFSPEAEQDLLAIWDYLAREGTPEVADNQLRHIDRVCERIAEWPHSGQMREEIAPGIRSVPVQPHVVFYRVTEAAIEIVRVLHGHRDIGAIFKGDPEQE